MLLVEIALRVAHDQAGNVHSEPVTVPDADSPFATANDETAFRQSVQELQEADYIPPLFAESIADGYPPYKYIRYGRRGKKELRVALPHELWYPRALLWAQALHVLSRVIDDAD